MSADKKHILILSKWYPNPADLQLGIFVQNHAALISEKFQVTVLYVQGIPDCPQPFIKKVITHQGFTEIKVYFKQSTVFRRLNNIIKYRKAQKIGFEEINTPVDLVHVQVPIRPAFLALTLKKNQNIPYLITEHWSGHLNGQYKQMPFYYRYFYKLVLNKANKITAVGEPLANELKQLTHTPVQIVPNYIQNISKTTKKLSSNQVEIISVSDLNNTTKNIIGLLEAFKAALHEHQSLHLTIIGDGPDKDLVVDTILNLHLTGSVTLLGRKSQQEVLALLPQYHFYICNSNIETFGMTVAEAVLAELPVICTKCGGPEAFINESNGMLIKAKDSEQLSTAIIQMAKKYKSFNMSNAAARISARYGKDAVLGQWQEIYNSTLP